MTRILSLLVPAFLLVLSACSPDYPNCKTDEHCKAKAEYCVNGLCQQCRSSEHCGDCQQCNGGRCSAVAGCCQDDGGCAVGQKCRSGQCGPECLSDEECGGETSCSSGRCVPKVECTSDSDCAGGKGCQQGRCVESVTEASCGLERIHFGFDSAEISGRSKQTLEANASCIQQLGVGSLTVEGHCDDRGTEEYNLALGERRARSARSYLKRLGVKGMRVVSYGENRPLGEGGGEAAHSNNRRAEFVP